MNATPYLHLLWKEYRASRTFWLALVALVILAQLLTLALSQEQKTTLAIVYGFALAAPVLFALGSTGAAFAVEKEEGTYDFLQAIPVTARQLVTSKLLLTVLATLAMYLLLWPIALAFTRGTLPETATLTGMLGLWLVAALEAIAWGAFFSLLLSRPLVAICLAVAAASTVAHLAASRHWMPGASFVDTAPYADAATSRIFGAILVLATDVYLGLRWLHPRTPPIARSKSVERESSVISHTTKLNRYWIALVENRARILATDQTSPRRPDRSAMLGHLFWQHRRQSRGLMVLMLVMHVAVTLAVVNTAFREHDTYGAIAMATIAAIMGSLVFLPDQERRHYRYFLEHNVPPRYVWLTRQVPWTLVITTSTIAICYFWLGHYRIDDLLAVFRYAYRDDWRWASPNYGPRVDLPDLFFAAISWVVVAYAAGQWASMHIRSGVMAAFCGLLISAALCGWVLLMRAMQLNWIWTVAPLSIVLLFATWLRAPNWIRENRSWRARTVAALVVLVPTVSLVLIVATYRVHQIPLIYQGPIYRMLPDKKIVQIARFQFDLPPIEPEALATGDLYRKANDLYVALEKRRPEEEYSDLAEPNPQAASDVRSLRPTELRWLRENSETISLLLEASRRPSCALADPNTMTTWSRLRQQDDLIYLLITDARRLEFEGHLDEALDRYFDIFQTASHLSDHQPFDAADRGFHTVAGHVSVTFGELPYWAAQKGQTSDRIRAAIKRIEALDDHIFHFDEGLKANYIIVRRYLTGDTTVQHMFFSWQSLALRNRSGYDQASETAKQILWSTLMPWENNRGLRLANLLTTEALEKLNQLRGALRFNEILPSRYFDSRSESNTVQLAKFFDAPQPYDWGQGASLREQISWLETTNPNLYPLGLAGNDAATICAGFGAYKRVWPLLFAVEAYRLDHGNVPETLDALVGDYVDELSIDPYSGHEYVYFPNGLPTPATDLEREQLRHGRFPPPVPGIPCIWSPGPALLTLTQSKSGVSPELAPNKETGIMELQAQPTETFVSYALRESEHPYWPESELPTFYAYARGLWYPIPPQQH